jgi:prostaglandin-H2 D-isomerase / glutathione transferase
VLHDEELGKGDMKGLKEYPRLAKLADAVRNRPNVKAFLNSPEYKG